MPLTDPVLTGPGAGRNRDYGNGSNVELKLYIPYIVIGDGEVLRIEEHDTKTMKAGSMSAVLA